MSVPVRDDHGSYEDAVNFALNVHDDRLQTYEFLSAWSHGDLDEWPEYSAWLDSRPQTAPETMSGKAMGDVAEALKRLDEARKGWEAGERIDGDEAACVLRLGTVRPIEEAARAYLTLSEGRDGERVAETWASINQWCDDTFGPATIPQIIERAKEEFAELETEGADHAIEAADVVICLCRIPGFAEALEHKMAINRRRKWRLTGNGTGYHIPDDAALLDKQGPAR